MFVAWVMLGLMGLTGVTGFGRDNDAFEGNVPPPPPEPNPLKIDVERGEAVWITLSAYSLTSPIIRFRIKQQPKGGGKLGTPKMVTPDTAVVRYQPPAGVGPGDDRFTYEVQSYSGVSAPADVKITISDKDPQLITPGDLEFGDVMPGKSATRPLEMENIGGGVAEGAVQVPDGWSVQGDPSYRLLGGQKQTFNIVFSPAKVGAYTGDIEYTGNLERATDLNGQGVAPIAVTTGTVELQQSGALREGTIEILNRTDVQQTLKLTAGSRLEVAGSVLAPAKGAVQVIVRAKGDDGEISDEVMVEGEGIKTAVAVHAAALAMDQAVAASVATPMPEPGQMKVVSNETATPGPAAQPADTTLPELGLPGLGQPQNGELDDLPAGTPVWALGAGTPTETEAVVGCYFKGAPPVKEYRLERQTLTMDAQGNPVVKWGRFANATLTVKGPLVYAKMEHLQPGTQYVVRLVGLDDHGDVVATSSVQGVTTVAVEEWWSWEWAAGVGVAAGVGGWVWWKRRRRGRWG
jgi:hypothetical protein